MSGPYNNAITMSLKKEMPMAQTGQKVFRLQKKGLLKSE